MIELLSGLGALLALALGALCPDTTRREVMASAAILFVGWALFNAPWHGWGLHVWTGLDNASCWALQDAVAAAFILAIWWRRPHLWLITGWGVYIGQIGCHLIYACAGNAIWKPYSDALDASYLVQLIILFGVGGHGAVRSVAHHIDNRRNFRNSFAAVSARTPR